MICPFVVDADVLEHLSPSSLHDGGKAIANNPYLGGEHPSMRNTFNILLLSSDPGQQLNKQAK